MRPALRFSNDLTWVAATEDLPFVDPDPGHLDHPDAWSRSTCGTTARCATSGTSAFVPTFVRYDERWFLELTPTYHFTRDGNEPDFYAGSHRSKIKRIERHSDFRRNVDTLARLLRGEVDLGGLTPEPEHQLLEFGELADVRLDTGEDDAADPTSRPTTHESDEADDDDRGGARR